MAKATMTTVFSRMGELHKLLEAGRASRETAMLELAGFVEAGTLPMTDATGKDANPEFKEAFAMFRDGKRATETSDLSLRSRFSKVCVATAKLRDSKRKFSAVLTDVAKAHTAAQNAATKITDRDKRKEAEPRQLIEAFYRAAQLQVDGDSEAGIEPSDEGIGANVIGAAVAKPRKAEPTIEEQLKAAATALAKALDKFVGKKPAFTIAPSEAATLRAAQNTLKGFAEDADTSTVAIPAEQAEAFAKWQQAQQQQKNGNGKNGRRSSGK